jgi:hypothetical protein
MFKCSKVINLHKFTKKSFFYSCLEKFIVYRPLWKQQKININAVHTQCHVRNVNTKNVYSLDEIYMALCITVHIYVIYNLHVYIEIYSAKQVKDHIFSEVLTSSSLYLKVVLENLWLSRLPLLSNAFSSASLNI